MCWCRFRRRVPEGSGGHAGVGSGGRFRKVPQGWFRKVLEGSGGPESSGACWCRFQRQGSESSGGFRRVPARVGVGSGGRVQRGSEGSLGSNTVLFQSLTWPWAQGRGIGTRRKPKVP